MGRQKTNTERNLKIVGMFKSGVNRKDLSNNFNLKISTIKDILLKNGIKDKPTPIKFNNSEIEFLKNFFPKFGAVYCSKQLKRSESSIRQKASRLNLIKYVDIVPQGHKKCRICKLIFSIENFDVVEQRANINNPYGRCRKCKNGERKAYYIRKSKDLIWLKNDTMKRMLARAKKRAIKRGFEFDLTYEWIKENFGKVCPIFNTPFVLAGSQSSPSLLGASIDRINNQKGYTKDNCIIISRRANLIKNNASIEELYHIAEFYKKLQESKKLGENSCYEC